MAKRKGTKDKQRSTKHTHNTKDRVTRTPLKTGDELRCSGRVESSCSTADFLVFVHAKQNSQNRHRKRKTRGYLINYIDKKSPLLIE